MKKILMTASVICISLMLAGMSYAYGPENIMAVWLFDENGGDVIGDSSGNGNDGTLMNGTGWTGGVFGSALEFDGVDDYAEVLDDATLDTELVDGFTIMGWFMMYDPDTDGAAYRKIGSYALNANHGDNFEFATFGDGQDDWLHGADVDENIWYHITATYDGDNVSVHFAGEQVSTRAISFEIGDTDGILQFGTWDVAPDGGQFIGAIDEVAIFNTVLSGDEIKDVMENGLAPITSAVSAAGKLATTWGNIK